MTHISIALANQMSEKFGCAPEMCSCGLDVWADDEEGVFVDARHFTEPWAYDHLCPGTNDGHMGI